ncbi:MAG: glycosyl hydrolase [Terracidiphilus sp.]
MRRIPIAVLLFAAPILFAAHAVSIFAQDSPQPVNPHATPEARALLAYLDSISGQATITGQHNYPNDGSRWTDLTYDLTAKYPGLFGEDFGFSAGDDKDSVLSRPAMIEEVKRQYRNGSVIALTWHEVRPTDDEPVSFHESVQGHLTDYEWQQLLTPGTPLYNRWCAQVDVVAGYLRQLREARIPVLFRAYHEMNGGWFWWGGRPGKDGSAALYRQIYDRFVNVHHLDNLVWVWNVNAPNPGWPPIADYYPGSQYADVVTIDNYGEFKQEFYESVLALAAGKPIALAEVGKLPSLKVLDRQPRWTYFMVWSEFISSANPTDQVIAMFHDPRTLNRDDPRLAGPMAAIRNTTNSGPTPTAVTPNPTAEATALLTRISAIPGHAILSGQENDPASPFAATNHIVNATERQPAIYATDLGSGSNLAQLRKVIAHQALSTHSIIALSWRPDRPTDDAPATAHGQLTDFEWNDLLTPGTILNTRWTAQVDEAAATLRALQQQAVAVLWNPYPDSNGKGFWWAGRKGIHGSAELYRRLFDRLVNHDGLQNLVWLWQADAPSAIPGGPGPFSDFFPGYLFTDAIQLTLHETNPNSRADGFLVRFAAGKPVGVELSGDPPQPGAFAAHPAWTWFLIMSPATSALDTPATHSEAMRSLYADPGVVSLAAKPE